MMRLLLLRLGQAVLVCWSVGTLSFILMHLLPGNMAFRVAAGRYGYDNLNLAAAQAVEIELGLDQPVWEQYLNWLLDLMRFDFGNSLVSGLPIAHELMHFLEHTLMLAVTAMLLALLLALPIGIYAAIRENGWFDRASLLMSVLLRAQPVFMVGLVLLLIFSLQLRWLPVAGFDGPRFLILPAISLALVLAALSSRVIRHAGVEVIHSAFFQFSRIKGLSFSQSLMRHGLRNAALPVVAFLGIQLVTLIEGIVMIESLFSWPGLGHGLAHAVFNRDVPMIQGAAMSLGLLFVVLNLWVDIACHLIDPRGRTES